VVIKTSENISASGIQSLIMTSVFLEVTVAGGASHSERLTL